MFIGEGKVADIKITQSMIDAYRAMPGNSLLTDSAIVALIEQGIEDNADWVRSLANSTKFLNNNTSSTNLFGFGFTDNTDYGWGFEKTTQQPTQVCSTNSQNSITPNEVVSSINPTPYETQQTVITNPLYTYAISFLKSISEPASSMVEKRDMEGGFNSDLVNWFIERGKNEEFGRTNVKSEISKLQSDIKFLELAAKGEAKQFSVLRGYYNVTFEEAFKQTRGVEFDQNAITLCDITANNYSQVKTCYEMINYTKSKLEYVTRGDITSNLELDKAGKAIIETFKLCGAQSIEDINKTLSDISEKYKNHPTVQKYGGEFRFAKNKDGKYVLYRTDKQGYPSEAPIEELRLIAKEMELRLNQTFATMTGAEFNENASNEEMNALANDIFNDFKSTYEEAFAAAYGGKDVKILAEEYANKQLEGLAELETINAMINIGLMIGPSAVLGSGKLIGLGAKALNTTAKGAKIAKGIKLAKGAEILTKVGSGWAKAQKIYSLPIMANMIIRPTELVEQWSSENKWSPEEISNYWKNTAINVGFMATGMASARIAANIGGLAKTSSLINKLKASGKSIDDLTNLIKTSPQNLPAEFVEIFTKADMVGRLCQIPTEIAIDVGATALIRISTGSELTATDVIMSALFAFSGGTVQNQVARVSEDGRLFLMKLDEFSVDQKIKSLKDSFGISDSAAMNILKTLDAAIDGTLKSSETAPKADAPTEARASLEEAPASRLDAENPRAHDEMENDFKIDEPNFTSKPKESIDKTKIEGENTPKIEEIKLLEGEELDAKIREVQQKLDDFDLSYLNIKLNKYNVMILDKILSNNILSENPNIEYFLRDFIKHIEDEDSINICNKIFSNKTLYSDNKIIANLNIILKSLTKNGYTLIDNILSNPNALNKIELYNLKDISIRCLYAEKDVFDTILNFCLNKKVIDSSTDWLKTFEELINSFGVINMAHNKNFKFELLNDFINNPNLCNSKNLNKLTKIFPQIETAKSLSLARKFLECQNEIAIEKISKNISEFFKLSEEEVNRLLKDETENNLIYISKDNKVNSILPKLEVESSVGLRFIDGILQNIFKQKPDFEFDVKKFKEYCNTVDINKLTEIAPNIKSFSNDELTVFMLYHFLKNNTSFSKESLSFPKDLTEFLSKNHMDAENLTYLLSIFPCTNRNIGSLPQGWLKEETSKTISDTIQKTIEDFTVSKDCDTFASALTNILGKKTKITELGSGQYGITYKISVDGCEDVVIKVFTTKSQETETGSCAEIQLGPFLNIHSNDYAHFYCGKITGMQNNDGYMLTQFLSGDTIPVEHVVQTQKYKILCHDNEGDRNTIQGKIFDFGFIEVIKP